jgi:membrane protease YdiL (CAAX protease family)
MTAQPVPPAVPGRGPGPDVEPDPGLYPPLGYHQVHRAGERGWWRPLVGVVVVAAMLLGVGQLVVAAVFAAGLAVAGEPVVDTFRGYFTFEDVSPAQLAFLLLGPVMLLPTTWLLTRYLHGLRLRWVTSVRPRMRWGYFAACLGLSLVAMVASLLVGGLLPLDELAVQAGDTSFNDVTAQTWYFLMVVLLVVPLQAAAEEYAFRGYLTQAVGGLVRSTAAAAGLAVVVPAVLFALAHGAQSFPVFVDRLAFGLLAGVLVVVTGGLEAAIALHIVNNVVAFTLAVFLGDVSAAFDATGGSWWSILVTLTRVAVYLVLAVLVARAMGLRRTSEPAVLIASRGRVYGSHPVPSAVA